MTVEQEKRRERKEPITEIRAMIGHALIGRFRRRAGRAGFTLAELLVSLVILSTGIVIVLETFQTSLSAVGESRDALIADVLLRERLAVADQTIRAGGTLPSSSSGSFSEGTRRFIWVQTAAMAPAPTAPSALDLSRRVEVEVTVWRHEGRAEYSVRTLYALPPGGGGE